MYQNVTHFLILWLYISTTSSLQCSQRPNRNFTSTPILILSSDKQSGYFRNLKECSIGCVFSGDLSLWSKADAWLERIPKPRSSQQGVKRPAKICPLQQYILLSMESEAYYPILKKHNAKNQGWDIISSTSIYSDVPLDYANKKYNFLSKPIPFENKTKAAAVFISNCGAKNERLEIVDHLIKQGFPIHSYGKCLNNKNAPHTTAAKMAILKSHLFSLAFENSNVHSYVTEKFYQSLAVGSIPIYYGAPNIKDFSPTIDPMLSIIDVNNIKGNIQTKSKIIFKLMNKLMYNKIEYEKLLSWKSKQAIYGPLENVLKRGKMSNCRLCLKVKDAILEGLGTAPKSSISKPSSKKTSKVAF